MKLPIVLMCGKAGSGKDTAAGILGEIFLESGYRTEVLAQADPMKRFAQKVFGFSEEQLWGPSEARERRSEIQENHRVEFAYHKKDFLHEIGLDPKNKDTLELLFAWVLMVEADGEKAALNLHRTTGAQVRAMVSPRYALQTLGTEFGRKVSVNVWSNAAVNTAKELLGGGCTYNRTAGLWHPQSAPVPPPGLVVITDGRFPNEVINVRATGGLALRISRPAQGVTNGGHASETSMDGIPSHFFDERVSNTGTIEDLRGVLTRIVKSYLNPTSVVTMDPERVARRSGGE